jgi:hypothetical protein
MQIRNECQCGITNSSRELSMFLTEMTLPKKQEQKFENAAGDGANS